MTSIKLKTLKKKLIESVGKYNHKGKGGTKYVPSEFVDHVRCERSGRWAGSKERSVVSTHVFKTVGKEDLQTPFGTNSKRLRLR